MKKCMGCGAIMQDKFKDESGYTPKLIDDAKYCQRCYRIKYYNELPKIVAKNEDYEKIIDKIIKKNALFILVVDIFSFKSTFNKKILDKLKGKDVILVANKFDLLPKSTKPQKVLDWLLREAEKYSFPVLSTHIISSKKGYFIDELVNVIDLARNDRDVYFLGVANVGKSSLINAILKRFSGRVDDLISESMIPGTTLNEIKIDFFDDGKYLIDTPGLINEKDTLNQILPLSYKKILPKNEIKPLTFQIFNDNVLFLGGLAYLKIKTLEKISIITYTSNELYIHRAKLENLDKLLKEQLGYLLTPPSPDEIKNIKYAKKIINFDGVNKKTIWFSSFGFVSVIGKCQIEVNYIDKTDLYITNAM